MLNNTGGIDKIIDQKVDAYRGNPQALQKRYSQNQELMDLLAMQKLKSEKETAARDMALKAEETPDTIAEQYEQQLVSMNKNEMANQVAGVLGQKQKQAQQRQQAMGITPQQRPQQRPQGVPQGIANQSRPNMQGMAQGGIVGYQEGEKVSAKEAEKGEMPSGFSKMFGDVVDWAKENPAEAVGLGMMFIPGIGWVGNAALKAGTMALKGANVLYKGAKSIDYGKKLAQATNAVKQVPSAAGNLAAKTVTRPSTSAKNVTDGVSKSVGREYSPGRTAATGAAIYGAGKGLGALDQKISDDVDASIAKIEAETDKKYANASASTPTAPTGIATDAAAVPTTGGGISTVDADKNAAMFAAMQGTQADTAGGIAGQMGDSDLKSRLSNILGATVDLSQIDKKQVTGSSSQMPFLEGKRDVNPEEKAAAERTRLKEDFNLAELDTEYKALMQERKDYESKLFNPETVKAGERKAYIDNLISGGDYMQATAGRSRYEAGLKSDRERLMKERAKLFGEYNDKRTTIVTNINAEAGKVLGRYLEDQSKAAATIADMEAKDIAMYQQEADRLMRANNSQIANRLNAVKLELDNNLQKLIQQQASADQITRAISAAGEVLRKQKADFFAPYAMAIQTNVQTINDPDSTSEEIKAAIDVNEGFEATWSIMEEKSQLTEAMDKMLELLGATSSQNSGGGSSTTTTKKGNSSLGSILQQYGAGNTTP